MLFLRFGKCDTERLNATGYKRMDLKRLRYFCRVVEQGSISQAAKVLNMAQPPLSKRIQELEEKLNVPLFTRQGNRIEPTDEGYFLYRKACEILRQVEDTARETVAIANKEKFQLRIGLTHLFQSYFKPLLLELYKRHPQAEINISVTDSSHLETMLNEGTVDLALIQRPYRSEGFDFVSFDPVRLVAATLLPSSEVDASKLTNCHVVDVFPSPQVFYPALVKIPAMNWLPEIMEIIAHGYPFIDSKR